MHERRAGVCPQRTEEQRRAHLRSRLLGVEHVRAVPEAARELRVRFELVELVRLEREQQIARGLVLARRSPAARGRERARRSSRTRAARGGPSHPGSASVRWRSRASATTSESRRCGRSPRCRSVSPRARRRRAPGRAPWRRAPPTARCTRRRRCTGRPRSSRSGAGAYRAAAACRPRTVAPRRRHRRLSAPGWAGRSATDWSSAQICTALPPPLHAVIGCGRAVIATGDGRRRHAYQAPECGWVPARRRRTPGSRRHPRRPLSLRGVDPGRLRRRRRLLRHLRISDHDPTRARAPGDGTNLAAWVLRQEGPPDPSGCDADDGRHRRRCRAAVAATGRESGLRRRPSGGDVRSQHPLRRAGRQLLLRRPTALPAPALLVALGRGAVLLLVAAAAGDVITGLDRAPAPIGTERGRPEVGGAAALSGGDRDPRCRGGAFVRRLGSPDAAVRHRGLLLAGHARLGARRRCARGPVAARWLPASRSTWPGSSPGPASHASRRRRRSSAAPPRIREMPPCFPSPGQQRSSSRALPRADAGVRRPCSVPLRFSGSVHGRIPGTCGIGRF